MSADEQRSGAKWLDVAPDELTVRDVLDKEVRAALEGENDDAE
ncbi:hypothetical protein [Halomarina oriensis]|nr:hypothetical protein [Halomarina oriensis]